MDEKIKWIKEHFERLDEPIHYIAYIDEENGYVPMTAEQFNKHTPVGCKWHKFDEPVNWVAKIQTKT